MKHLSVENFTRIILCSCILYMTDLKSQGGPKQPEYIDFKPVAHNNLVDNFTGDMKYSIPVMDVEGFPIVLNYMGNVSNNEDASWVGLGWNLNVGSVSRQLRGLPDEFNGQDILEKSFHIKPKRRGGIFIEPNFQLFNWQPLKRVDVGIGLSLGIFHDNYTGWGHELGISPTVSLTETTDPYFLGAKITSNTESGLSIAPLANFGGYIGINQSSDSRLNVSLAYSNREGIKEIGFNWNIRKKEQSQKATSKKQTMTYNPAESITGIHKHNGIFSSNCLPTPTHPKTGLSFPAIAHMATNDFGTKTLTTSLLSPQRFLNYSHSFNFTSPTYNPTISMPMRNTLFALSLNIDGSAFGIDLGGSVMGNYSEHALRQEDMKSPLYGYLYSDLGKDKDNAVLDFNRINDVPYNQKVPAIGVPNYTYDLFMVNQPDKSSQYRAYRNSSGVLFDNKMSNTTGNFNLGGEMGAGWIFQGGLTINSTTGSTVSEKWKQGNEYLSKGDFVKGNSSNPIFENFIFKSSDELVEVDEDLYEKIGGEHVLNVSLRGIENAGSSLKHKGGRPHMASGHISSFASPTSFVKKGVRQESFSFITKGERLFHGIDKQIFSYSGLSLDNKVPVTNAAKDHHISEITIINDDGRRHIYGVPVYNNFQKEVSFSVDHQEANTDGFVEYSSQDASKKNNKGLNNYFNSETLPAYPHTWLLTAILSNDYQDVTGDGISDDDIGTAYKINYTFKNANYQWRTPATRDANKANFNKGLQADERDNRANYVFGSREEWFMHSIESRNYVAFFHISERTDAIGQNEHGGLHNSSRMYQLDSISLYFKKEFKELQSSATPIKVVRMNYDYSLCQGIANSLVAGTGKLTLKDLSFTFGKSKRSDNNEYEFTYENNPGYGFKNADRWGMYKDESQNAGGLKNEEFPYTLQDEQVSDQNASAWLLSKIHLPSGSDIKLYYEADRYSYVQNKRAAYMQNIIGFSEQPLGSISTYLYDGDMDRGYIFFKFPDGYTPKDKDEFKRLYLWDDKNLNFSEKLYFNANVELFNANKYEFIRNYAEIEDYGIRNADTGWIKLKSVEGNNPISFYSWQLAKSQIPMKAYPWSKVDERLGPFGYIMAMKSFFGNLAELFMGYDGLARDFSFAKLVNVDKSHIRLLKPDYNKIGGGYRVKRVEVNDNWSQLTNNSKNTSTVYGMVYDYGLNDSMSSGVAEYEPLVGGDENPMRKPLVYTSPTNLFGPTTYHHIDEPICEAFYPAPKVGYSKVTTRSIYSINSPKGTGWDVFEFYTAKDFPVETDRTHMNGNIHRYKTNPIFKFLKLEDKDALTMSQGNLIIVNNMHGKEKAVSNFSQDTHLIAEKRYKYQVDGMNKLDNFIHVVDETGAIAQKRMGVSFDFYTDMRQSKRRHTQKDIELGGGFFLIPLAFLPIPFPHTIPFQPGGVIESNFHSSSTMKYIKKVGILKEVYEFKDGASNTTKNLLYDRYTGQAIVTKEQNNYKDSLYSIFYPAYWKYREMDLAYKNQGIQLTDSVENGNIDNIKDYLFVGDVLSSNDSFKDNKYWVVDHPQNPADLKLIDRQGQFANVSGTFRVLDPGRKNLLFEKMFYAKSYVSPLDDDDTPTNFSMDQSKHILETTGTEYSDRWKIVKDSRVKKLNCDDGELINTGNSLYDKLKSGTTFSNWLNSY